MPKLDAYLRSIEKFGATGAVLTSNQPITLRFPTGDRHATQVTPHDLLVPMLREVAPPAALDLIDKSRPARFDYDRYAISVAQRANIWLVTIEQSSSAAAAALNPPTFNPATLPPTRTATPPAGVPARTATPPIGVPAAEMMIERTQYDAAPGVEQRPATSGSGVLDELTRSARARHATDVFLAAGAVPMQRADGQLAAIGTSALSADQISRELGLVAPAEARGAWSERGAAVFGYSDGAGRIRATLGRDQRGPVAALRLLPSEAPGLDLGLDDILDHGGLLLVAGGAGSGKTIALGGVVRALAERRRRVITIEDPIELIHATPWVSQREVGAHVPSLAAGVAFALREAPDAIAVGAVDSPEAALALVEAIAGGCLVVTTITSASASGALERFVDLLPVERRDRGRLVAGHALLGTVAARRGAFEVLRPDRRG
jgi:Tfp pilus assembly pilus retraction ATPase PilT